MGQQSEPFFKLLFAWPCICTWCLIFLCPGLLIHYTKSGDSGDGWVTSTCLALQHAGNITSSGQFQRLLSLFQAWVSVAGQNLLHQSHAGIVPKMLTFWVLSWQRVQLSCQLCGTYKSAPGCVIVSFSYI